MKGNNSLVLCPAEMQIIVQEWIDRNIKTKPRVTNVRTTGNGAFEVTLNSDAREATA